LSSFRVRRTGRRAALSTLVAALLPAMLLAFGAGPAAAQEAPAASSIFGADVRDYQNGSLILENCPGEQTSCAKAAGLNWVRQGMEWAKIQPKAPRDGYTSQPAQCAEDDGWCYWDTSYIEAKKAQLKQVVERGFTPVVIVQSTPEWVNGGKNSYCYMPSEAFDRFAEVMRNVTAEFKAAGIGVKYWQIWNEPEATMKDLGEQGCATMGVGSFGDENDPWHGGGRFGDLMAKVYPAIKQGDADAKVLPGGWALTCEDCHALKFFEGMLRHDADGDGRPDGGKYFDVYDYHAYAGYDRDHPWVGDWSFNGWNTYNSGRGYLFDKLVFVRELLARYGAADKPIVLGESGLTCSPRADHEPCPDMGTDKDFTAAQANFVIRTYTRAMALGLMGVEWYSFGDGLFNETELVDTDAQTQQVVRTRSGYLSLKFLADAIGGGRVLHDETCNLDAGQALCQPGAQFRGTIGEPYKGYDYEGYSFCKGTTAVGVVWSNKIDATKTFPLDTANGAVAYDIYGNQLQGTEYKAAFEPMIVKQPNAGVCGYTPPAGTTAPPATQPPATQPPASTPDVTAPEQPEPAPAAPLNPPGHGGGDTGTGGDTGGGTVSHPAETRAPQQAAATATTQGEQNGLPFTGAGTAMPILLAGLVLLVAGTAAVVTGRRRAGRR
jgi:hypothetical protein